jgi:hypothetical protein
MFMRRLAAACAATVVAGTLATAGVVQTAPSVGAAGPSGGGTAYTIVQEGESGCRLATVDLATGAVVTLPAAASTASCVGDLTQSAAGAVYGVLQVEVEMDDSVHLIQFDTSTGAATDRGQVGTFVARIGPTGEPFDGGIAFDRAGRLFVSMVGDDDGCKNGELFGDAYCLYEVDATNPGNATFKGLGTLRTVEHTLTTACDGRMMTLVSSLRLGSAQFGQAAGAEGVDTTSTTVEGGVDAQVILGLGPNPILNLRDPANGAMTPVGTGVGADVTLTGLEFDAAGTLWAIGVQISGDPTSNAIATNVFTVDPATGIATPGPVLSGDVGGIAYSLALPLLCPVEIVPTFTG